MLIQNSQPTTCNLAHTLIHELTTQRAKTKHQSLTIEYGFICLYSSLKYIKTIKLVLLQVDLIHFGTGSLGKEVLANKPAAI